MYKVKGWEQSERNLDERREEVGVKDDGAYKRDILRRERGRTTHVRHTPPLK